jgi:hypothetical protein
METESQYQVAFTFQRGGKLHHVNKSVPRKCKNMAEAQEWALGVCLAKRLSPGGDPKGAYQT